jgi:hypothetical protein
MMRAQIKKYETSEDNECEVHSFDELMAWAAPVIKAYQADDFYPGMALSANADWENNLSFGVTDRGYIVIVNRGEDFDYDQWRLNEGNAAGIDRPWRIRWDEIENLPAEWLVSESSAKQAIDYWIAHQKMDPRLDWVSTET